MGRPKGSKNRPKDGQMEKKAPVKRSNKGGGPVSLTSMRAKPTVPLAATMNILNGTLAPRVRIPVENGKTYMKELAVPVEDHEVALAATDMVREIRKREAVLEQRREAMAGFKETLVWIDKRMQDLASTVENHTKLVPVRVTERLVVETSTIEVVRMDTGEICETRSAESGDLQTSLLPEEPSTGTRDTVVVPDGEEAERDGDFDEDEPEVPDIEVTPDLLAAATSAAAAEAEADEGA